MENVAEETVVVPEPKKGRGRPRIHPLPDPNAPKKPRGRPKKEKAEELEEIRNKYLAMRAGRTQTIRDFNPGVQQSDDAYAAFLLCCHLVNQKIQAGETFITGGELMDLCLNLTGVDLRENTKSEEALVQGAHRISKYDTAEVKDGIDTFAYGTAPDGKTWFAKELHKSFVNMRLFWPNELAETYTANIPNADSLEWAARQAVRKH